MACECELVACCQFFDDKMEDMPKSAAYIKNKLCFSEYESCARYRIYKEYDGKALPMDFFPNDAEEVNKVIHCLRNKRLSEGMENGGKGSEWQSEDETKRSCVITKFTKCVSCQQRCNNNRIQK